jgi:hypothetical protein
MQLAEIRPPGQNANHMVVAVVKAASLRNGNDMPNSERCLDRDSG